MTDNYQQYRFTTAGGKVVYAFVWKGDAADLKKKMRLHGATKAEPVEPTCPVPATEGNE